MKIVPEGNVPSWASFSRYDTPGPPGVEVVTEDARHVYLWRSDDGVLRGVFVIYLADDVVGAVCYQVGELLASVEPGWQRRGILTALLEAAESDHGQLNLRGLRAVTAATAQFIDKYLSERGR